ncbi:MAG TPA: response regulator transcription factor [Bacteroidales bacterium]
MTRSMNIIIAETSSIVYEGLTGIIYKSGLKSMVSRVLSFDEIQQTCAKRKCDVIILNPSFIQTNLKPFHTLKNQFENVKWIGLVYAYFDQNLLSMFDALINISDSPEAITASVQKAVSNTSLKHDHVEDVLSDREIDILRLLTTGLSNKEIADKLNISINTVITHRKNISQKTGIKSVSGLTIYAVVKKLISLENLSE